MASVHDKSALPRPRQLTELSMNGLLAATAMAAHAIAAVAELCGRKAPPMGATPLTIAPTKHDAIATAPCATAALRDGRDPRPVLAGPTSPNGSMNRAARRDLRTTEILPRGPSDRIDDAAKARRDVHVDGSRSPGSSRLGVRDLALR
jgi:hypothetical protein